MADKYYCKKCGQEYSNVSSLTASSCPRGGKHELYDGPVQAKYICKKCGQEYSNLTSLTGSSCPRGGNHEPAR